MSEFSTAQKRNALKRELIRRQRTLPKLVRAGSISGDVAARELKVFSELVDDFDRLVQREENNG